jgi:hypothetical protein
MVQIKCQREKLDDRDDNGGDGALNIRFLQRLNVRRQRQGKKEEEEGGPLN